AQEAALRPAQFDEDDAWRLGLLLREEAARRALPLAIEIRSAARVLFAAALPGSAPDNADWIRRKSNLVLRMHRSSYGFGRGLALKGAALGVDRGLDPADYAAHGGAFPIHVQGSGVVAVVTVSGLPQREDHRFVTWGLCQFLGLDPAAHDLPAE
ncbi:heme-degrading domain-containing protein, partial [Thioclava sp. BHET1]